MTTLRSIILTLISLSIAAGAQAATLYPIEGELLVSGSGGFRDVVDPAEVSSGDTVIARSGARGTLVYANDCKVAVGPGDILSVQATSPCKNVRTRTDWVTETKRASDGSPYWVMGLGATALIGALVLAAGGQ